jgi:hypothetical protein
MPNHELCHCQRFTKLILSLLQYSKSITVAGKQHFSNLIFLDKAELGFELMGGGSKTNTAGTGLFIQ